MSEHRHPVASRIEEGEEAPCPARKGEDNSRLPLAARAMVSAMASPSPEPGPAAVPVRALRQPQQATGRDRGALVGHAELPGSDSVMSSGVPEGE